MPNSLGSSCTADVQAIDWKMTLAGFVFLFSLPCLTVSIPVCVQWVWRHLAPSQMNVPGVVAVFSSCWQEAGFQQGMWLGEGSEVSAVMCGIGSCSSCWHLAGEVKPGPCRVTPSMGSSSGLCLERGEPGEGGMLVWRGSCLSGCACSNPALFPLNFSAKTCWWWVRLGADFCFAAWWGWGVLGEEKYSVTFLIL